MDDKHEKHIHSEVHEESIETVPDGQQVHIDESASFSDDPLALQIAELLENESVAQGDTELDQQDGETLPVEDQFVQSADESILDDATDLEYSDDVEEELSSSLAVEEEELNRIIEELCTSKAEEFILLGYEGVTGKDIWEFVSEPYHQKGIPPLHKLINDILSLRVTDYMNWLTLSAYKGLKFNE